MSCEAILEKNKYLKCQLSHKLHYKNLTKQDCFCCSQKSTLRDCFGRSNLLDTYVAFFFSQRVATVPVNMPTFKPFKAFSPNSNQFRTLDFDSGLELKYLLFFYLTGEVQVQKFTVLFTVRNVCNEILSLLVHLNGRHIRRRKT